MTEQTIYPETPAESAKLFQQKVTEIPMGHWQQLDMEHQIQLAQRVAELIQRMRKAACQEMNTHEWL